MFSTKCIAPELIKDEVPSQKADVYSLGMILIEMITLEIPYTNLPDKMIIQSKIKGEMPEMFDRIGDEKMKSFIAKLIQTDPNKRPTIEELIEDNFLKISSEDDLVIKIKPRKKNKRSKKLDKDEVNTNETIGLKGKNLFKRDFEETPYFEEIKKDQRVLFGDGIVSSSIGKNSAEKRKKSKNIELDPNLNHIRKEDVPFKPESNINLLQIVTSSHEGATPYCSKYFSDVYHPSTDHNKPQIERNSSSQQPGQVLQEDKQTYKIIDDDYNVHLKFLINQDNKLHELQFTYNLLKDNIPDLMEEIKNEFDFSYENLNHIYETLKKVHIYSKFDKNSELLPDNSF